MIAKYQGWCKKCGGEISAGEEILWNPGFGASHDSCPKELVDAIRIYGGEGYGCAGWYVGQVIFYQEQYLYVMQASKKYYAEDGLSFGVGDDQGYIFSALCRLATTDEAAPLIAKKELAGKIEAAKLEVKKIKEKIQAEGSMPNGKNRVDGQVFFDSFDIYGFGSKIVLEPTKIWLLKNNGSDGDDWSRNNITTGGAGAIGWQIPYDDILAKKIIELSEILKEKAVA